jgi:hypothetical protein
MIDLFTVFLFSAMIAFMYLFFKYLFVCTYSSYRVSVRFLGVIPIFDVPLSDIIYYDYAFKIPPSSKMLSKINIPMSFSFNPNKVIFIVTKNSDVFSYTMSPKNPEEFLRILKSKSS